MRTSTGDLVEVFADVGALAVRHDLVPDAFEELAERLQLDGLPLMGRLWTLRIDDDEIVLRIARAGLNGTEVPRQPPPPPDPKPDPPPPPPPPTDIGGR